MSVRVYHHPVCYRHVSIFIYYEFPARLFATPIISDVICLLLFFYFFYSVFCLVFLFSCSRWSFVCRRSSDFCLSSRISWGGWWVLGVLPRPVEWLVGSWRWGKYDYLPHRCGDSAVPVAAPRQDRLGCTIDPMIALRRANTLMHVL